MIPKPMNKNVVGTKCVFINKLNEKGEVTRNKERLVCKGYAQEEGVDYDNNFTLVSSLEGLLEIFLHMFLIRFKV